MPLFFITNSKAKIKIETFEAAKKAVLQVPNPQIKFLDTSTEAKKTTAINGIAHIDTGEALILQDSKQNPYNLLASTGTSSCIQAFFYTSTGSICLMHFNSDF